MKEIENSETFFSAGKEIPYKVPEGYFDELPSRIQQYCLEHSGHNNTYSIFQIVRTQLALAAGFIGFVLFALAGYYYLQPKQPVEVLTCGHYIDIVSIEITDYDEAIIQNDSDKKLPFDSLKHKRTDEMIQYLLEENLDYVTLIEQY